MERKKLTKEDIDRVRHIEGFPIGTDEDIIALSDAPYYTACPNPFIEDFIKEYGTPYDEETDEYHREPFAFDVSEGKRDAIYNAHTYHTKVPYKAIMRYILHYTNPGDVVLDGFRGTGMTGVAANRCEDPEDAFKQVLKKELPNAVYGRRHPILADISPIATFIARNYNSIVDLEQFSLAAEKILDNTLKECEWMYKTNLQDDAMSFSEETQGDINYVVWSDVLICPHCGEELVFYEVAADSDSGKVSDIFTCTNCKVDLKKKDCAKAFDLYFDGALKVSSKVVKQVPVLICYQSRKQKYFKKPDPNDLAIIKKIEELSIPYSHPVERMREGRESRRNDKIGLTHVHHYFYKRTLYVLSKMFDEIKKSDYKDLLKIMFTSQIINISKMNRYRPQVSFPYNPLSGTLYVSSMINEANPFIAYAGKVKKFSDALAFNKSNTFSISNGSTTELLIPSNSCDYIFTDPPFGDNLNYSELSFLWEAWLGIITNNQCEAIVNTSMDKDIYEYQKLMTSCFAEYHRVLKPNRWITVEFHNSKNSIWNIIQESLQKSGFIVADVRTLDKQGSSFKQTNNCNAVKQDLVISAYKPKNSFTRKFLSNAGSEETAWDFARQHLENIPIVVMNYDKVEVIAERQAYLLFDRMVAYHIMNGVPVPLDSTEFYKGLDERFLKRDNMYFLADQVNEYDTTRIKVDIEEIQFDLFVTNEKSAIAWLYQQLSEETGGHQTYAEIQPKFMQEVKLVDKFEEMPELSVLLEENFLQDEENKWYIPDRTKEGDVAKLREKKLWKEFEGYTTSKGKLKLFRSEAIRVGFSKLWKDKNYSAIVDLASRLPDSTIQEDPNLLMYYDISSSRL